VGEGIWQVTVSRF